jgi:hypothetical protein
MAEGVNSEFLRHGGGAISTEATLSAEHLGPSDYCVLSPGHSCPVQKIINPLLARILAGASYKQW